MTTIIIYLAIFAAGIATGVALSVCGDIFDDWRHYSELIHESPEWRPDDGT